MIKSKVILLSSAAFIYCFTLSVPSLKAMEVDAEHLENTSLQPGGSKKRKGIEDKNENSSPNPSKKLKIEDKKIVSMEEDYPLTKEGNNSLKMSAKNGNKDAYHEVIIRWGLGLLLGLDKNYLGSFDKLKNEALVKPEYVPVLFAYFNEIYEDELSGFINQIKSKAKETANLSAYFSLGWMYQNGMGTSKKVETAVKHYKRAAKGENAEAQYRLGLMYATGEGVTKNLKKAREMLTKAANQGHPGAQFRLTTMVHHGEDVEKNPKEAFELLTKSANQGYADAQYRLGLKQKKGEGVEVDIVLALDWFTRAAEQEHPDAQYQLGLMLLKGEGVKKNPEEAFNWFQKAAEKEHRDALYELACMYDTGAGVKKSLDQALKYYKRAAELGNADAQFEYGKEGNLYHVVDYNGYKITEHEKWIRLAAENGSFKAQLYFTEIYKKMLKTGCYYSSTKNDWDDYYKYLNITAKQGCWKSFYWLGVLYDSICDRISALIWYMKYLKISSQMVSRSEKHQKKYENALEYTHYHFTLGGYRWEKSEWSFDLLEDYHITTYSQLRTKEIIEKENFLKKELELLQGFKKNISPSFCNVVEGLARKLDKFNGAFLFSYDHLNSDYTIFAEYIEMACTFLGYLTKTKPGFLITIPQFNLDRDDFPNEIDKSDPRWFRLNRALYEPTYVEYTEIDSAPTYCSKPNVHRYVTVGIENCELLKKILPLYHDLYNNYEKVRSAFSRIEEQNNSQDYGGKDSSLNNGKEEEMEADIMKNLTSAIKESNAFFDFTFFLRTDFLYKDCKDIAELFTNMGIVNDLVRLRNAEFFDENPYLLEPFKSKFESESESE